MRVLRSAAGIVLLMSPIVAAQAQQAVIRGTAKYGELAAQTCMVVRLNDDGLIMELEEYIDPASMKPLRG